MTSRAGDVPAGRLIQARAFVTKRRETGGLASMMSVAFRGLRRRAALNTILRTNV